MHLWGSLTRSGELVVMVGLLQLALVGPTAGEAHMSAFSWDQSDANLDNINDSARPDKGLNKPS